MELLEQIENSIKTGQPCQGKIGAFEFTIAARSIPGSPMHKPTPFPLLRDWYASKDKWHFGKLLHEKEEHDYQQNRRDWIAEKATVARLEKIYRMVRSLLT